MVSGWGPSVKVSELEKMNQPHRMSLLRHLTSSRVRVGYLPDYTFLPGSLAFRFQRGPGHGDAHLRHWQGKCISRGKVCLLTLLG